MAAVQRFSPFSTGSRPPKFVFFQLSKYKQSVTIHEHVSRVTVLVSYKNFFGFVESKLVDMVQFPFRFIDHTVRHF